MKALPVGALWVSMLAASCAAPAASTRPVRADGTAAAQATPVVPPSEFPRIRRRPLPSWSQAEREYIFPRWAAFVRATRPVKRGTTVHPLPDGGPLRALQPGGALAQKLERHIVEHEIAGLIILVDGKVRLERYARGHTASEGWPSFSVVKSITSTLAGAAIEDGSIASVDDPLTKYIVGLRGSAYEGVTVRQLLTMTSGVKWNEDYADPRSDVVRFFQSAADPGLDATVSYMRKLPREAPAGTKWLYKTGETELLGVLVARATKRHLADYLSEKIWSTYGMEHDAAWQLDSSDEEHGGTGFVATLRDFARFGQFVLDGGQVDGRPVVPANWLPDATRTQASTNRPGIGYGYQWWTRDDGTFSALGIHGQMIAIDRARRLVVVMQSVWPVSVSRDEGEARSVLMRMISEAVDADSHR